MLALVDADIVAYRCAATAEKLESWIAVARTRDLADQILQEVSADAFRFFLSGPNNFRYKIYPQYKANRNRSQTPRHLNVCRDVLVKEFAAEVTIGYEADDALGIAQCAAEAGSSIICSIDKDLKQIPGDHYNFVKKEFDDIPANRAIRAFYESMLIGDRADNIKGVSGIGLAKAPKFLEGCKTEQELFDTVRGFYNDDAAMLLSGQLLWIWRKEDDLWTFDRVKSTTQEAGQLQESMQLTEAETSPFMALT